MLRRVLHLLPTPMLRAGRAWLDEHRSTARHRAAVKHLQAAAGQLTAGCLEGVRTLEAWESQRPQVRQQLRWMLGLDPWPERTPLNARITGVLERSAYRIEKLVFESLPGLLVTANLYLPKQARKPAPCVIYLCAHWASPFGAKTGLQDRYLWYPVHGLACLAIDLLAFGEASAIHHGTHNLNRWDWFSLGYTPAGVEVWNTMRALDWLETRPEVDRQRVGVTGISGGGVMTWLFSALDERVKVAAPSCSTYTAGSQASGRLVRRQCDCTFYPNVFGLDFPAVGALIAPRPLLITSGRRDGIFPPSGYHEAYQRAKRIYDLHAGGDSDHIREVDANVGHTDSPRFLQECQQWMCRWLDHQPGQPLGSVAPGPEQPCNPQELACLGGPPEHATNFSIDTSFIRAARLEAPPSKAAWQDRREQVLSGLRATTFRWFPHGAIPFATRRVANRGAYVPDFADFAEFLIDTEPGVPVRVLRFRPRRAPAGTPCLIVVKRPGDSVSFPDTDDIQPLFGRINVIVLHPRFSEVTLAAIEFADLERTAALTGRTIAALRVWDVLRVVEWVLTEQSPGSPVSVHGRGEAGVLALYAALLDRRIKRLILSELPTSHRAGPALLTVLRQTDIPEVAGLLAPRRIAWLGGLPPGLELTRQMYDLWRAGTSLASVPSLVDGVNEPAER